MKMLQCAGCDRPILDRFLLNVLDRSWHAKCVQCYDCRCLLSDKCFSRDGKLYCRTDFFKRFGTKCGGCSQGISPTDLVRRARSKVFHLKCFTCLVCRKQLSTGEELYILDEHRFICKDDYLNSRPQGGLASCPAYCGSVAPLEKPLKPHYPWNSPVIPNRPPCANPPPGHYGVLGSASPGDSLDLDETNDSQTELLLERDARDSSVERDCLQLGSASPSSVHMGLHDGPKGGGPVSRPDSGGGSGPEGGPVGPQTGADDGQGGTKRRGPRTTIKAKQLETLKAAFAATPKPTRHIREQLAQETGLNMRVIQVWFQNRRSKERRMKQLSTLGARRHFFRSPRRVMRSLRPGLSPDPLDDSPPDMIPGGPPNSAFGYFSDSSNPAEFNYAGNGPPSGFYDFFPGQPAPNDGINSPYVPHHHQNSSNLSPHPNGQGLNLGSDAPYLAPTADLMGSHGRGSSPDSVVLGSNSSAGADTPFPSGGATNPQETAVW